MATCRRADPIPAHLTHPSPLPARRNFAPLFGSPPSRSFGVSGLPPSGFEPFADVSFLQASLCEPECPKLLSFVLSLIETLFSLIGPSWVSLKASEASSPLVSPLESPKPVFCKPYSPVLAGGTLHHTDTLFRHVCRRIGFGRQPPSPAEAAFALRAGIATPLLSADLVSELIVPESFCT